jgi:hypothetical protein
MLVFQWRSWPLAKANGYCNYYILVWGSLTGIISVRLLRSHVGAEGPPLNGGDCDWCVTAVAAGQSQRLYSGVGIFHWYYLSSPPQIPRGPRPQLERRGLIFLATLMWVLFFILLQQGHGAGRTQNILC